MASLKEKIEAAGLSFEEMMDTDPDALLRALCGDASSLDNALESGSVPASLVTDATAKGAPFCIWAEENGGIATNAYEWSWGNGATGNDIGIPMGVKCELIAVSLNADVAGTSVTMRTEKNGADAYVSTHPGQNSVDTLVTPVPFDVGDRLSFRTGTVTGTYTDVRVCAWFREV